eukprot:4368492-Prymnesium_polylepis.1
MKRREGRRLVRALEHGGCVRSGLGSRTRSTDPDTANAAVETLVRSPVRTCRSVKRTRRDV